MTASEKHSVEIFLNRTLIEGELSIPSRSIGIVIFAHGASSGLKSPRDQFLVEVFNRHGIGTLRFQMLTEIEEHDTAACYNISALANRLIDVTHWLRNEPRANAKQIGYFGAGRGGAVALKAAAKLGNRISVIVLHSGWTHLVEDDLASIQAPTLLITGGEDTPVVVANRACIERLSGEKRLVIIPGASHRFEEEGAIEEVARHGVEWFERHFHAAPAVSTNQAVCASRGASKPAGR